MLHTSLAAMPPRSPSPPTSTIDVTRRTGAPSRSSPLRTRSMWITKSTVWAIRLHTANSGRLVFDFDT
jgi:hypothetical protein